MKGVSMTIAFTVEGREVYIVDSIVYYTKDEALEALEAQRDR